MSEAISILIIDDEPAVRKAVSAVLKKEEMTASCASSAPEALSMLEKESYDLILLDIMMPDQDGFSLLKELRNRRIFTPVILLSGKDEDTSQVKGLGLGADDYITKPFSKTVLVSKIRAIVRRTNQYAQTPSPLPTTVQTGSFTLHMDTQTVETDCREISLTSKEFALLCLFLENPGQVFTKQELFAKVWKSDIPDDNTILVYIKKLRDKIEEHPARPAHLKTVWGKGYRFDL